MPLSSLARRVLTAAVLVPLVLAALFLLPVRAFALAVLIVVLAAAFEWARLVGLSSGSRIAFIAAIAGIGAILALGPPILDARSSPAIAIACGGATLFWFLVAPAWLANDWPTRSPLAMGVLGAILLLALWIALVELQARSPWLVLAAMAIVWIADTAAYFAGRAFGRRKLAPSISPGKSWEGVLGALVAVALYAMTLVPLASAAGYPGPVTVPAAAAFVGLMLVLAGVSVVGDLFESLLKRHAGVKDSGSILPGHGGLLDRIDALLAAMPPAALAAVVFLRGSPP